MRLKDDISGLKPFCTRTAKRIPICPQISCQKTHNGCSTLFYNRTKHNTIMLFDDTWDFTIIHNVTLSQFINYWKRILFLAFFIKCTSWRLPVKVFVIKCLRFCRNVKHVTECLINVLKSSMRMSITGIQLNRNWRVRNNTDIHVACSMIHVMHC